MPKATNEPVKQINMLGLNLPASDKKPAKEKSGGNFASFLNPAAHALKADKEQGLPNSARGAFSNALGFFKA